MYLGLKGKKKAYIISQGWFHCQLNISVASCEESILIPDENDCVIHKFFL